MEINDTIFLGIVQGLTEFLPISSSGHLVIFQNLLGLTEPELLLDCSLHLGTLLAICVYFRTDLKKMTQALWPFDPSSTHGSLLLAVVVGTIPTGFIGLAFRNPVERLFQSVPIVAIILLVTGSIVAATRFIPKRYTHFKRVGILAALIIGLAQGLAIIPGISRSGATIVCGLLCGLDRELAGRFSFLLSIPAIVGAVGLQLGIESVSRVGIVPLIFGFGASAVVGFLALKFLMGMIKKGRLHYFAPYCWAAGLLALFIFF